jgi:hypothetical protein
MTFVASGLFGLAAVAGQPDTADGPPFDVVGAEAAEHPETPPDPDPAG